MNRVVKFRAWDKVFRKMYDVASLTFGENGIEEVSIVWNDGVQGDRYIPKKPEEIVLMQDTGLKDADGVEIFEGDLMQDGHSGRVGSVLFKVGRFIVLFNDEIHDLKDWTTECVVGNVFENHSLVPVRDLKWMGL